MNSFPSYHCHLAQMPTDQRELEYHQLPVQTTAGTLPGALQPYGSPVVNWPTSRSSLALQSVDAHTSDNGCWGVKAPGYYEHLASSQLPKAFVAESSACSSYFMPSSHFAAMDSGSDSMRRLKRETDHDFDFSAQHHSSLHSPWIGQQSSHYHHHHHHHHHVKLEESDGASQYIPTASSSPISTSSQHYHSTTTSMTEDSPNPTLSGDDDSPTDPPYSQLIYQALREAPDCKLKLQDIYLWFEQNTNKGKESTKGWQNSIRHNLSMNAGFEPVRAESSTGKRPANYWCLTPEAIKNGRVESTTRYRRNPNKASKARAESANRQHQGVQRGERHTGSASGATSRSTDGHRAHRGEKQRRTPESQPQRPPQQHPQQHPQPNPPHLSQPSAPQYPAQVQNMYPAVSEFPPYHLAPIAPEVEYVNQTLYFGYEDVTGLAEDPQGLYTGTIYHEPSAEVSAPDVHPGVIPRWEGTMQMRQRF